MPLKAGVEAAYGVEIRLLPTGSGRGLAELAAGHADAAMLSGPIDYLLPHVHAVAATGLKAEDFEQLKLAKTSKAEIVALVNPSNPVRTLSADQLRAILTGEIVNWSAVGGPDRPIALILTDELDGVRASVATGLLEGRSFAANAEIVKRVPEILPKVAAAPGAVGLVPRATLAADSVWAEVEPKIAVALYLVARKDHLEADSKLEMVLNSLHSRAR